MKRRVSKIANFFAFNLLFFALYLNFIHKDKMSISISPQNAAFSGTVLVDNQSKNIENNTVSIDDAQQTSHENKSVSSTAALKLSIN